MEGGSRNSNAETENSGAGGTTSTRLGKTRRSDGDHFKGWSAIDAGVGPFRGHLEWQLVAEGLSA